MTAHALKLVGIFSLFAALPGCSNGGDLRALVDAGQPQPDASQVQPDAGAASSPFLRRDTFTLAGARTDRLYNDNSNGAYVIEQGTDRPVWTPATNFSFNTPQSSTDPSLLAAATGNPGAATGLAQSGGGDFSVTYADPSGNYVVQADAIIPGDRFDISSLPAAGAAITTKNSLSVFFRRDTNLSYPGIGIFDGTTETATGCTTGITDYNWHHFAVNFKRSTDQLRISVDGKIKCDLNLNSFAGGIYKDYSSAAVGMGGTDGVTWMDNFQAGPSNG